VLGAEAAAQILDKLADAHLKLSEGQGAELLWREADEKRLSPLDALKIYALKTAPAFEAALFCGARLAGEAEAYREPLAAFARHLGVAFQILNDLKDWEEDTDNKLASGLDVLAGRPTVLWALALEGLPDGGRDELASLTSGRKPGEVTSADVTRVRALYQEAGVFEKASRLVDKYQQRAEAVADEIQPDELRRLLYYLIDMVLHRSGALDVAPPVVTLAVSEPLPAAAGP
jgi:geranylgeranyl pyrophosphate synthase